MASATSAIANRDYYLILDKSGSMTKRDMPGGKSRWSACEESVYAFASKIIGLDPDGITLYTFSKNFKAYQHVRSAEKISDIFLENEPYGGTMLAPVLRNALQDYFATKNSVNRKANGATILVVTDGSPEDQAEVMNEIIMAANTVQTDKELAINFIQVGHDAEATSYLKYLDEELSRRGAKFDIVSTIKIDDVDERGGLTAVLHDTVIQPNSTTMRK